ncbi:unnamed protein product [Pylaiella littoralis]
MHLLISMLILAGLSAARGVGPAPIQMDVHGGETRCLADTVRVSEDTTFAFKAVETEGTSTDKITVTVEHPNEQDYTTQLTTEGEEHRVEAAKGEGGSTYTVCFQSFQPTGRSTRVELLETTILTQLGPRPSVRKHLQPVDLLLQHALEVARSLRDQLKEGATNESEWIESDRVLRSRINKVAGITILVLLSVSGWQLVLLNRFFRSKKLI